MSWTELPRDLAMTSPPAVVTTAVTAASSRGRNSGQVVDGLPYGQGARPAMRETIMMRSHEKWTNGSVRADADNPSSTATTRVLAS